MSEEKLSNFLKSGQDWARLKTSIPGVFVLKMPAYKNSPARLAIEVNPVDAAGNPTKRRGLILRSLQELAEYSKIFQNDKISVLLKAIEKINPPAKKSRVGEDVVEI